MVEPGFPGVAEAQCLSDTCGAVLPTLCLLREAPLCALAPVGEDGDVPGGQKGRGRLVGAHPVVPRCCHSTCRGQGRGETRCVLQRPLQGQGLVPLRLSWLGTWGICPPGTSGQFPAPLKAPSRSCQGGVGLHLPGWASSPQLGWPGSCGGPVAVGGVWTRPLDSPSGTWEPLLLPW